VLRKPRATRRSWRERIGLWTTPATSTRSPIGTRRHAGARRAEGRGISLAAFALAQSVEHILSFFGLLRSEMGFLRRCLNLCETLTARAYPVCVPEPFPTAAPSLAGRGLYDVCLACAARTGVVPNDLDADAQDARDESPVRTGAGSRPPCGIGLAQLMMQCGMFVTPSRSGLTSGTALHALQREEDASLRSGKLDESQSHELHRGRDCPTSLVLFNESFASTNEPGGVRIARQIIRAMLEAGIKCAS